MILVLNDTWFLIKAFQEDGEGLWSERWVVNVDASKDTFTHWNIWQQLSAQHSTLNWIALPYQLCYIPASTHSHDAVFIMADQPLPGTHNAMVTKQEEWSNRFHYQCLDDMNLCQCRCQHLSDMPLLTEWLQITSFVICYVILPYGVTGPKYCSLSWLTQSVRSTNILDILYKQLTLNSYQQKSYILLI